MMPLKEFWKSKQLSRGERIPGLMSFDAGSLVFDTLPIFSNELELCFKKTLIHIWAVVFSITAENKDVG